MREANVKAFRPEPVNHRKVQFHLIQPLDAHRVFPNVALSNRVISVRLNCFLT